MSALSLALLLALAPAAFGVEAAGVPELPPVAAAPELVQPAGLAQLPAQDLAAPAIPADAVGASAALAAPEAALPSPADQPAIAAEPAAAPQPASPAAQAAAAAAPERFAALANGGKPLDVVVVAAEAVPFVKTGGLADVVDAVGRGLAAKGHRVTLVMPAYANLNRSGISFSPAARVSVPVGDRVEHATVLRGEKDGVEIWLLDGALFNTRDGPYAHKGQTLHDNDERFIVLSRGALEAVKAAGRSPDIIHAHDWHAALVAPYLKLLYKDDPAFARAKSVLSIHNLAYHGEFPPETILKAGFGWEHFKYDAMEHWGRFNFLKAGLQFADALTTVSRNYAREIQTDKHGVGLDGLLRHRSADLTGIVNGVDHSLWNPGTDQRLARQYGPEDVTAGKAANKAALQAQLGLDVDAGAPLFAVASRFDWQKGIDLVAEVAPRILERGGQLILAGSSDPHPELDALRQRYPTRLYRHGFSENFAHQLFAASDFLLMFSRFEPCGLSQLMAQLYGSIPIVTPTGGLVDTVTDISAGDGGDGIFLAHFSAAAALQALARAEELYHDAGKLAQVRRAAMEKDSSWGPAVDEYVALFQSLLARQRR